MCASSKIKIKKSSKFKIFSGNFCVDARKIQKSEIESKPEFTFHFGFYNFLGKNKVSSRSSYLIVVVEKITA